MDYHVFRYEYRKTGMSTYTIFLLRGHYDPQKGFVTDEEWTIQGGLILSDVKKRIKEIRQGYIPDHVV